MAVETDPGSKPEKKTAPVIDHEARARELEAKLAEKEQREQQLAAALQDPEIVRNLAANAGVLGRQNPGSDDSEDDGGTLVDRKELKRHMEQMSRQATNAIVETTSMTAKQVRAAHLRAKRAEDPKFKKYESEVVRLLDQMSPMQSSDPETIEKVYNVVKSNHLDDETAEIRERVREEERERLRARGIDVPDDEDETEEEAEEEPVREARQPGRSTRPPGAMGRSSAAPSSGGSPSRNLARTRAANQRQLTRDEKMAAQVFGLTEEEQIRYHPNSGWKPDIMGAKGRTRF